MSNEGGTKFDGEKARVELLSPIALIELSKVLTFGAKKYGDHNWRGGFRSSRLLGAILRHVLAYLGGETRDPESGLSHIAHAMAGCMFLLEQEKTKPDLDDRYNNEKKST